MKPNRKRALDRITHEELHNYSPRIRPINLNSLWAAVPASTQGLSEATRSALKTIWRAYDQVLHDAAMAPQVKQRTLWKMVGAMRYLIYPAAIAGPGQNHGGIVARSFRDGAAKVNPEMIVRKAMSDVRRDSHMLMETKLEVMQRLQRIHRHMVRSSSHSE